MNSKPNCYVLDMAHSLCKLATKIDIAFIIFGTTLRLVFVTELLALINSWQILQPLNSHHLSPCSGIHALLCSRGSARQLRDLSLFNQKRPHTMKATRFCQLQNWTKICYPAGQIGVINETVTFVVLTLWVKFTSLWILLCYFLLACYIGFGYFPDCKLYNHKWISIHGASGTDYQKQTPDLSRWSRAK